jgi:hypothetical protein
MRKAIRETTSNEEATRNLLTRYKYHASPADATTEKEKRKREKSNVKENKFLRF